MSSHRLPLASAAWEAKRAQVGQGCIGVEVEPELGRLDADLGVQAAGHDLVEQVVVVIRHGRGLRRALQVLAEMREEQANAQRTELLGRLEGVLHLLARHEAAHRTAREPEAGQVLLQPSVAGHPEQDRAHRSESSTATSASMLAPGR